MLCAVCAVAFSGVIYLKAGVLRDINELGIKKENAVRGMHAAYCDTPYGWDREFSDNNKVKILVIGNSFARDWANVLNESDISEQIEISYVYYNGTGDIGEKQQRANEADYVFYSTDNDVNEIENEFTKSLPSEKLYYVGYKNFGSSNGIIYSKRNKDDYFSTTVEISSEVLQKNSERAEKYEEHFIDMITPVQTENGEIRVFTDDNYYISADCTHLTEFGAKYYSRILDLSWIVE